MSCQLADYFYETHFRDRVITKLASHVRQETTNAICGFVNFYGPLVDDQLRDERCKETLEALFAESGLDEDRELVVRLKELIQVLDTGLDDAQRQQLNSLLARSAGIQVDFNLLRDLQIALDCSVGLDVDYGDIITSFDAREVLLTTLDSIADDGDPTVLSEGEQAVDAIDRAFGNYDEQLASIDGFASQPYAPIDVNRFAPMYNTIALNKLILLSSGQDRCKTLKRECQGANPPPGCGPCEQGSDDVYLTAREFPAAGILGLVQRANQVELAEAYEHAYSTDLLDETPETYLQSFFQEQFVEEGSWAACEKTGFNVACGAFYSIDDPNDYCQALSAWDPDYLADKYDQLGVNQTYLELGISAMSDGYSVTDCAFVLADIDTEFFLQGRERYAPNPRFRTGPLQDPGTRHMAALSARKITSRSTTTVALCSIGSSNRLVMPFQILVNGKHNIRRRLSAGAASQSFSHRRPVVTRRLNQFRDCNSRV